MVNEQNQDSSAVGQSTDIAEGLPPPPPVDDRLEMSVAPSIQKSEPSAADVFIAWEKLRIVYNIALWIGLLLAISGMKGGEIDSKLLLRVSTWLLIANAGFSFGPVAEGYLCWLRVPRSPARRLAIVLMACCGAAMLAIWIKLPW